MYALGKESMAKLLTADPLLRKVVMRAIEITTQDFKVIEGARSKHRQMELYAQGRTPKELQAKGFPSDIKARPDLPEVTWTLNSRHFPDPKTGLSRAVDMPPFPISWENTVANLARFDAVAKAMMQASKELNIPIRWGADWDRDGKPREKGETDSPHFELV